MPSLAWMIIRKLLSSLYSIIKLLNLASLNPQAENISTEGLNWIKLFIKDQIINHSK